MNAEALRLALMKQSRRLSREVSRTLKALESQYVKRSAVPASHLVDGIPFDAAERCACRFCVVK